MAYVEVLGREQGSLKVTTTVWPFSEQENGCACFPHEVWHGDLTLSPISLAAVWICTRNTFLSGSLVSIQRLDRLVPRRKGHVDARCKSTTISLIAGTLGPACSKNLPLEDLWFPSVAPSPQRDGSLMDCGHMT